jgi:hypothetical protein
LSACDDSGEVKIYKIANGELAYTLSTHSDVSKDESIND